MEAMRQASRTHATELLAALRAVGVAYVGFATRHPSHFRVMFGREVADRSAHPDLRETAGAAFELLADAVGQCQRAGVLREGDSRALAVSAWAMVHGLADLR
jgi:AcrR family transcriptional regulator